MGRLFKNWVKKNAAEIFQHWSDAKNHDLWIVTSTYATKKCAINICVTMGNDVLMDFWPRRLELVKRDSVGSGIGIK